MKRFIKFSVVALSAIFILGATVNSARAATNTVNLLTATDFAILAYTQVTNVSTSAITGNVGLSPSTGAGNFPGLTTGEVTGTIYAVDAAGPAGAAGDNPVLVNQAKVDLTAAYLDAAGRTPFTTLAGADNQLGGQTLTDGVYRIGHASTANLTAAAPLTLDAQGDPTAVFIFQSSSDLIMAASSEVRLINNAQACNVFWQVTSSASLLAGASFKGSILALTSITVAAGANVEGRLLAQNGNVTLISDTIAVPDCTASEAARAAAAAAAALANLPNTGIASEHQSSTPWNIIIPTVIAAALISFCLIRRKQRI